MSSILKDINDLREEEERLDKSYNSSVNEEKVHKYANIAESFNNKGYRLLQNYDYLLSVLKLRLDIFSLHNECLDIKNYEFYEWNETTTGEESEEYFKEMCINVFLAIKEVKELLFTNNNNSDLVVKKVNRDLTKLQLEYDLYDRQIKENGFSDKLNLGKFDNDKYFLNDFFEQFKELSGLSDNHFELNEESKTEKIDLTERLLIIRFLQNENLFPSLDSRIGLTATQINQFIAVLISEKTDTVKKGFARVDKIMSNKDLSKENRTDRLRQLNNVLKYFTEINQSTIQKRVETLIKNIHDSKKLLSS